MTDNETRPDPEDAPEAPATVASQEGDTNAPTDPELSDLTEDEAKADLGDDPEGTENPYRGDGPVSQDGDA